MGGISKTGNNVHFNNVQNRDVEQKSKKGEKRSSHILSLSSRLSNIKESIARKIDRDYSLRHGDDLWQLDFSDDALASTRNKSTRRSRRRATNSSQSGLDNNISEFNRMTASDSHSVTRLKHKAKKSNKP